MKISFSIMLNSFKVIQKRESTVESVETIQITPLNSQSLLTIVNIYPN